MPGDGNNSPFEDSTGDEHTRNPEAVELRQQIAEIYKKLTGENSEPVTNNEIAQFLRVLNYNFTSLIQLLQAILLKSAEMDTTLMSLEMSVVHLSNRLQQFFETNSMLDEIMKGDLGVSGSAPDNKFIF